jgi:hypothetical protein
MKNRNTEEEKGLLRKRNLVERVIGKLKRFVGDNFSRFRTWAAAKAVIGVAMVAINLGF